jgi:hypothetical protein
VGRRVHAVVYHSNERGRVVDDVTAGTNRGDDKILKRRGPTIYRNAKWLSVFRRTGYSSLRTFKRSCQGSAALTLATAH